MFSMFQHGLHQPSWLWAAPRLLASAVYLGRFLGKFSSWSWQTTLHWWLWGDKIWMIWMSGWKGYLSLWKKKQVSQRMTTKNIWEPEAAWADVEAEWRLFYDSKRVQGPNPHNVNLAPRMHSFLRKCLMTRLSRSKLIWFFASVGTWRFANWNVSHAQKKQGKYKRNLFWHPLRLHPLRGVWYCGVIQSVLSGKQVEYPAISYYCSGYILDYQWMYIWL